MSTDYPTTPSTTEGGGAKEQASKVGHEASESTKRVAGTATDEAKGVAREAKNQAREMYDEAKMELRDQASSQQSRAASSLRTMSDELRSMADRSEDQGMASQLVSTTASKAGDIAGWLEQREPGDIIDEVRSFARRRPGVFIGIAALAGLAVGRLTRGIISGGDSDDQRQPGVRRTQSTTPVPDDALGTAYTGTPGTTMPGTTTGTGTGYTSDTNPGAPGGVRP
ncbi:hypothetical protein [Cryobacterium sp. BB736]|uniref:hypothetical protein n=1 Tax=Cryobacterium sp. BB736 TaxID=2746963 RepID=UPI0018744CCE|nr:hypothetical protein [Cryobacterium sp. BB736]